MGSKVSTDDPLISVSWRAHAYYRLLLQKKKKKVFRLSYLNLCVFLSKYYSVHNSLQILSIFDRQGKKFNLNNLKQNYKLKSITRIASTITQFGIFTLV